MTKVAKLNSLPMLRWLFCCINVDPLAKSMIGFSAPNSHRLGSPKWTAPDELKWESLKPPQDMAASENCHFVAGIWWLSIKCLAYPISNKYEYQWFKHVSMALQTPIVHVSFFFRSKSPECPSRKHCQSVLVELSCWPDLSAHCFFSFNQEEPIGSENHLANLSLVGGFNPSEKY